MTDNPMLGLMLNQISFLGSSTMMDDEDIMPIPDQLSFSAGDMAIVGSSSCPAEEDFAIVQCLDPAQFADLFPDWEERIQLSGYVLCTHFSRKDPELTMGWFSRLKVMPISPQEYAEALTWMEVGFPDDAPEWVTACWRKYADELGAGRSPPTGCRHSVTCPKSAAPTRCC